MEETHRLIAIGDIHGCLGALQTLIEKEIELTKNDEVIFLGDYIDRGPNSRGVVDYIFNLIDSGFNIIPLRGNHEEMLINAIDSDDKMPLWLYNGGKNTLLSYGVTSPRHIDPKYIDFFRNLKHYHAVDNFLFAHAGFNDKADDPLSDIYYMMWVCRNKYKHPQLKDKTIVHGHCVTTGKKLAKSIASNKKVLSIDTGCVYNHHPDFGTLTALEMNTKEVFAAKCEY